MNPNDLISSQGELPPPGAKADPLTEPQGSSANQILESLMSAGTQLFDGDERSFQMFLVNPVVNTGVMSGVNMANGDVKGTEAHQRSLHALTVYVERESVLCARALLDEDARLGQIVESLRRVCVTVVHGAADLGAMQLAFAALHRVVSDEGRIVELERVESWSRLRKYTFESGVGYTVEVTGSSSGTVHDRRLLSEKLREAASFLIVRHSTGQPAIDDLVHEGWVLPPDVILERLLRYLIGGGGDPEQADRLLRDESVRGVLSELTSYSTIARLATGLTAVIRDGEELDRLLERMKRSGEQTLLEWFDKVESTELRCHLLAAAVLDGMPWSMVVDAARDLQRRLQGKGESDKRAPGGFGTRFKELVSRIEADIQPVSLRFGRTALKVEGVRVRNEAWIARAYDVAVRHFVDARETLLAWLRDLGLGDNFLMSRNLGRAAALVADRDFLDALENLLTPWARSKNAASRQAVAEALESFSQMSVESTSLATEVVRNWLKAPPEDALAMTAMSVLTQPWGLKNHERTLQLLRERVKRVGSKEVRLVVAVLARLVSNSDRPADTLVMLLEQCQKWTRKGENLRGWKSVGELIALALLLVIPSAALLDFMSEKKEVSRSANLLMALAMRRPEGDDSREHVIKRLLNLVEAAHGAPRREDTLRRFMSGFGLADNEQGQDRKRLATYMKLRLHDRRCVGLAEELAVLLVGTPSTPGVKHVGP
ncbi:hypothetical protein [Hyalangium versicolor]|uniref:hypothetical protein n=1 Tax=Hyalangium versicolor TaxID=2861190 RepID=UPI001CCCE424|nr:hypothetical protein [Hyalangium versicolor]